MWMQHLGGGVTREALMQQFVKIGNSQADAHKVRQQLRKLVRPQGGSAVSSGSDRHALEVM